MALKSVSYKEMRLEFFADKRKTVQRRLKRLEKLSKPEDSYLSKTSNLLRECGMELSFYDDIIEMLEEDMRKDKM
jgi:hypothetical protein